MSNATLVEELIGGLPLSTANPMPIIDSGSAPLGGGIIWGAPTAVAVTAGPTSTTLVVANAARKAISIWNPIGNAQMSVNIAGGAAVLVTGLPLLARLSRSRAKPLSPP